jgi:hypothetical protein
VGASEVTVPFEGIVQLTMRQQWPELRAPERPPEWWCDRRRILISPLARMRPAP